MKKVLREWSVKSSNHALPKLIKSKNKLFAILWALLFLFSIYYCLVSIIYDIYVYNQFKTNTRVDFRNSITAELPTISICGDLKHSGSNSSRVLLTDCEIRRSRYLEVEKCDDESFYWRSFPNGECITLNTSFFQNGGVHVTSGNEDIGLRVSFWNNDTNSIGIYVLAHQANMEPPTDNNHYDELFECDTMNAKTRLVYAVTSRKNTLKLAYPYSSCVNDWSSINEEIVKQITDYLIGEYVEETCMEKCTEMNETDCNSMCPFKCESVVYLMADSSFCDKDSDKREATVNVFIRDTLYTSIEEVKAMSVGQLLGAIGGRLSISLGMSIISFIDFIEGAAWIFCSIYKSKRMIEPAEEAPTSTSSDNLKLSKKLKHELIQWSLNCNIHGVGNIFRSKYLSFRIIWFVNLIGSLVYCVITLEKNYSIYNSFAVRSKYSIERDAKTFYPALTFCGSEDLRNDSIFVEKSCHETEFKAEHFVSKEIVKNSLKCQTLNIPRNDTELVSAKANGNSDSCKYSFSINEPYLLLFVHNQSILPLDGNLVIVERGRQINVGLTRFYHTSIPKPYSNCAQGWQSIDTGIVKFYEQHNYYDYNAFEYNQKTCFTFCLHKNVAELCNYTFNGSLYENLDVFNGNCSNNEETKFKFFDACESSCPVKCNEMTIRLNIVSSPITSNRTTVFVFYEETSYTQITDEPVLDIDELIASIGGQLGLSNGISLLSIVDLFFLLINFLSLIFK